jgi:Mg-chelatase subunit ChlD
VSTEPDLPGRVPVLQNTGMPAERQQSIGSLAALLLAALATSAGRLDAAQQNDAGPLRPSQPIEEREKTRLRSVRLRIRPTGQSEPGACLDLDVSDLKIRLRGRRIDDPTRVRLDRSERRNVHALLIDTSGSMTGKLEYVREAAKRYLAQLDTPRESGLVATFDESVILRQSVTSDRMELIRAVDGVRMAGQTSMHDGLVYAIRELKGRRERPVVLLLSDGVDVGSLNERHDVVEIAASRPDLMIFTIGLQLPPLVSNAPAGYNSTRSLLQRLATRTHGKYFEAPTPSRLAPAYKRIRELLDNEAILDVIDPDPDAEPGKLDVGSARRGCAVDLLGELFPEPLDARPVAPPYPLPPTRVGLAFSEMWNFHVNRAHHSIDPACGSVEQGRSTDMDYLARTVWYAEIGRPEIRGCALDLIMEPGLLYDPMSLSWNRSNAWIRLATRPFRIPLAAPASLPHRPEELLDRLAEQARKATTRKVQTDPRQRPAAWHARPYSDLPMIFHGRTFLEMRPGLAHALFLHDAFRSWTMGRLQAEARADLDALERRLRRSAPDASLDAVRRAVALSPEARRIRERTRAPRETDLQRYLSACLGPAGFCPGCAGTPTIPNGPGCPSI